MLAANHNLQTVKVNDLEVRKSLEVDGAALLTLLHCCCLYVGQTQTVRLTFGAVFKISDFKKQKSIGIDGSALLTLLLLFAADHHMQTMRLMVLCSRSMIWQSKSH